MYGAKKFCRVDTGIGPSSRNERESGNESEVVVDGDGLGFPRSLNMLPPGKPG